MTPPGRGAPRVEVAGPEHESGLLALFRSTENGCHCRYWHFTGDKNAWLYRCANAPGDNAQDFASALRGGDDSALGVVALADEHVVGWMKVAPWSKMEKLRAARPYQGLTSLLGAAGDSGARGGAFAVACVLILEEERRRSLSRALLRGAEDLARARGASSLLAFPRDAADVGAEELWLGPPAIFRERGFRELGRVGPYPILRKELV